MGKITDKQKRFGDEYLIDLNATQAAIRAGYSKKTAYSSGQRMLKNVEVQKYIEKRMAEKESELIASQDEVLKYLTSVMRREKKENVVVTLNTEETKYAPDENGVNRKQTVKVEKPEIVEIPTKISDSNKAAELLGKRYGLFKDNVSLEVEPITIVDDLTE